MSMTIAQAKSELMQIYGMLSPDKQRAIDTLVKIEPKTDVSEYDIDHIWYKGGQYISLRRFLKVKAEAEQEPKIGHWIEEDVFDGDVAYRCSECNELFWIESGTPKDNEYNFCPKCGARMVEPQESEE